MSTSLVMIASFGSWRYQFFPLGSWYAAPMTKWRYLHTALWRVKYSRFARLSHAAGRWYMVSSLLGSLHIRAVGDGVKFQKSIYSCLTHIYAKKEGFPTSGGLCEDRKPCRQNLAHHFHEEKKMFIFPAIFGMSLAIISTYCQSYYKTR